MSVNKKKSFVIYIDYRQHLDLLTDKERGRLLTALFDYAESKKIPDLSGAAMMAFSFIKAQMDRDEAKYIERCRINRENGLKGGRPPKPKTTENNPEETEDNPEKAKITERFLEKPKKPDTDTDNDNDTDNDTRANNMGDKPPEPPAEDPPAREPVPYKKIQDLFRELCPSYPAIRAINGQRKKAVAARWNECKDIKVFEELFKKAEASSFLKGRNDRNWRADFDWMMKPTNFAKILENRYEDKGGGGVNGTNSRYSEQEGQPDRRTEEAPTLRRFKMATDPEE